MKSIKEKIEEKIERTSDGCWIWKGSKFKRNKGSARPQLRLNKKRTVLAHRLAFEAYKGPIEQGKHVLHKCDRPLCVNPDHLFLGTSGKGAEWRGLVRRPFAKSGALPAETRISPKGSG